MVETGNALLSVGRQAVTFIDPATGETVQTLEIPGAKFPNDITAGTGSAVYVSDSAGDAIYKLRGAEFSTWLQGGEIGAPNCVEFVDGELLVGNGADGSVKAVDPETGDVRTLVYFGTGNIDGIKSDGEGGLFVSQWEGRLYHVSPDGELTRLIDTTTVGGNIADFEYVEKTHTLVVPTFTGDEVVFYEIGGVD
jgi:sugar lactone lactonase YvrE